MALNGNRQADLRTSATWIGNNPGLSIVIGFAVWATVVFGIAFADAVMPKELRLPIGRLNFETTGHLGDSFGFISAAMASTAAFFAYKTYKSAQAEAALMKRKSSEPTYLDLLERRFYLVENVHFNDWRGFDAISKLATHFRNYLVRGGINTYYAEFVRQTYVKNLRNYFRFQYHIIKFAEDLFGVDYAATGGNKRLNGSYPYVRIMRSQLSDDEILLMALNAAYDSDGMGSKELIERYALLHNMPNHDVVLFGLKELFHEDAFGLPPAP